MQKTRLSRAELVAALVQRDGLRCAYPGCAELIDLKVVEGKLATTIDHWIPQCEGKARGWTMDEIWDLSNLTLMHKKCNAKKGNLVPNDDGTLPEKVRKEFRYRRDKRASRPEICFQCNAGRDLGPDEICASCGSGPMPERFPRWAKVKSTECDHELFWCWACSIGIADRVASVDIAVRQGESGEW